MRRHPICSPERPDLVADCQPASQHPDCPLGASAEFAKVRIGLIIMSLLGIAPLIVRVFEFPAMHIAWDQNAYGSIVWVMLGLHTTHI
jgi:hypothetical protein